MRQIYTEELLSIISHNAISVNEEQMIDAISKDFNKQITHLVFFPSGDGLVVMNDEQPEG